MSGPPPLPTTFMLSELPYREEKYALFILNAVICKTEKRIKKTAKTVALRASTRKSRRVVAIKKRPSENNKTAPPIKYLRRML